MAVKYEMFMNCSKKLNRHMQKNPDRYLKQVGFHWNRTVAVVVDKLPSTSVDFIRSERELEKLHLYGV